MSDPGYVTPIVKLRFELTKAQKEIERLTKDNEDLQYANDFCGRTIGALTADVRTAFSDGFWVGCDAPAALPKGYVDKAFDDRALEPGEHRRRMERD